MTATLHPGSSRGAPGRRAINCAGLLHKGFGGSLEGGESRGRCLQNMSPSWDAPRGDSARPRAAARSPPSSEPAPLPAAMPAPSQGLCTAVTSVQHACETLPRQESGVWQRPRWLPNVQATEKSCPDEHKPEGGVARAQGRESGGRVSCSQRSALAALGPQSTCL